MINILKLDLDLLNKKIQTTEQVDIYHTTHYIIMNEHTLKLLKNVFCYKSFTEDSYPMYRGCPISICNALADGEIEVR